MKRVEGVWAELSANKVELNSVKNLQVYVKRLPKNAKQIDKMEADLNQMARSISKIASDLQDAVRNIEGNIEYANDEVKGINKAFSDLGMKPSDSKEFMDAQLSINQYKGYLNFYKRLIANAESARKALT